MKCAHIFHITADMDAQRKTKKVLIDELTVCQRALTASQKEVRRLTAQVQSHERALSQTDQLQRRLAEFEESFFEIQKQLTQSKKIVFAQQQRIRHYGKLLNVANSRQAMVSSAERKITTKSKMSVSDLVVLLEKFVFALKNGTAQVSKGIDTIFLLPAATLKMSVKGAVKKNDSKFKIVLSWPQFDLSMTDVDETAWDVLTNSGNPK